MQENAMRPSWLQLAVPVLALPMIAACAAIAGAQSHHPAPVAAANPDAALAATSIPRQSALDTVLGIDDARLLLTRTGFGATPGEVAAFAALTRAQAVDRLLAATVTTALTPPPPAIDDPASMRRPGRDATASARNTYRIEQRDLTLALRAWWLHEMLVTPSPLTERMTLFWHGHFTSSQQKVRLAPLVYRQNVMLRANAVGNFATLLHAASKDPAMLVYLDTAQNRRGHPNENFAREVMELFTLGEGHYSEQDIKEAARAFTGWSMDRDSGTYRFRPRLHDDGVKTVFGHRGNFDGDGVLDLILARPQTAQFIVSELWREFISPDPDAREVARIAARFSASGYDIKTALRELFESDAFYSPDARGALVKSPVDLVAGTLRTLGIFPANALPYAVACAGMGQNLFAPPNVKGWPGGDAWINTSTLLARKQFLARIARADNFGTAPRTTVRAMTTVRAAERKPRDSAFDAAHWTATLPPQAGNDPRARALRMLLPIDAVDPTAIKGEMPDVVRAALQDPAYQLE
jgi:uncharacterized protein (DUF1800 family)